MSTGNLSNKSISSEFIANFECLQLQDIKHESIRLRSFSFGRSTFTRKDLLSNPILNGYLLHFVSTELINEYTNSLKLRKSQLNNSSADYSRLVDTNQLEYALEIYFMKDLYQDTSIWNENESYHWIDQNMKLFDQDGELMKEKDLEISLGTPTQNSLTLAQIDKLQQMKDHVVSIWNKFLSLMSEHYVYIPERILSNTICRLKYLQHYGPRAFDETLTYFNGTIKFDLISRFKSSQHFHDMITKLKNLSLQDELVVIPPRKVNAAKWIESSASGRTHAKRVSLTPQNLKEISIYDIFHDRIIYEELLEYAKSIKKENEILLMRLIYNFKCFHDSADIDFIASGGIPVEAENLAWKIYRFFIAKDSLYSISVLTDVQRKTIMRKLAHPDHDTFNTVEKVLYLKVQEIYSAFSQTKEFLSFHSKLFTETQTLVENLTQIKNTMSKTSTSSSWNFKQYFRLNFGKAKRRMCSIACER